MATGMITRHFEHPSGATATLEMPAGWSRNCWCELKVTAKSGTKLAPDRKTFSTPEEARQAAIAREREALANGWKPKMAAMPQNSENSVWHFYRPNGERIPLNLKHIEEMQQNAAREWPSYAHKILQEKRIRFTCAGQCSLEPGDRFLLRQRDLTPVETTSAFFVQSKNMSFAPYEPTEIDVQATITAMEPGESAAIEQWHNREAIIQAGVETDTSLIELWAWLGTRIQDSSERQQVNAAIVRGRAERQARLQREQEQESMRRAREEAAEIDRQRQAAIRAIESTSRPLIRITPEHERQLRQQQTEETLRKLSGGTDLSKPKKRKIDLGE